jgi:fatty-acyl-CoA synthase
VGICGEVEDLDMIVPVLATQFLERALKLYPGKLAVVCEEKRFSYEQYGNRVNQLSNALLDMGVGQGDRVAFLGPNCHRLLEAYYGVVQIGAILLPLNIRLLPADFAYILDDAGASVLFVDGDLRHLVDPIRSELRELRRVVLMTDGAPAADWEGESYEELMDPASTDRPRQPEMGENDVCELFYTSGTTGRPKGVMLTHRNVFFNAVNFTIGLGLRDRDVQLHTIPLFHANGWGTPHALTWVGGTHVMIKRFEPERVFELIEDEGVTLAAMVPTMVNMLLNSPELADYDLSSLDRLAVGGAASPPAFVGAVEETLGCTYVASYGMTETSPVLTFATIKDHLRDTPEERQQALKAKAGLPVPAVDLRVVDEAGRDVEGDGEAIGEVVVRSNVVMSGYWGDTEASGAMVDEDGWFHTGDMATMDEEGYILIADRKKDIIISGGENISSLEVERTLYSHPAVLEAAVIAVPHEFWGEVPKAIVALKPEHNATAEEIIQHCREHLASYKVPKEVDFVEELPKGGTGKILKTALKERYRGVDS